MTGDSRRHPSWTELNQARDDLAASLSVLAQCHLERRAAERRLSIITRALLAQRHDPLAAGILADLAADLLGIDPQPEAGETP